MDAEKVLNKYYYLLPNMITALCLICGVYAIIFTLHQEFSIAAMFIVLAGIADILDGRVARLTHTQSEFGKKFDSLADLVAFGMAPPILAYQYALLNLGWMGSVIAVCYTLAVALRLARFSMQSTSDHFSGVPCPPTSCMLAVLIWMDVFTSALMIASIMLLLSVCMVSKIQYPSLKNFHLKKHMKSFVFLMFMAVIAAVMVGLPEVIFAITLMYMLSGPLLWPFKKR